MQVQILNKLKNGLSDHQSIGKAPLSKIDNNNNKMNGLLIVKTTVNNKNNGNKLPSDFIINIHANDPSVVSFNGNSSETRIKLSMGMYAVSERANSWLFHIVFYRLFWWDNVNRY